MKILKKLLFAANLLLITSFVNAQYLVDATFFTSKSATEIQNNLNNWGWDASSMELNGVTIYKITYNTIDVHGNPTIASGAIYVPQTDCDTLPLVTFGHGTVFEKSSVPSNGYNAGSGFLYSGNGFITTLPDYLGLGDNPGIHPYVHWESEATASIDLIRAAREFLNDDLLIWDNNQLFLTGYSQGGHSTMAIHKYISINNLQSEFNVVASAPLSGAFPLFDVQWPGMIGGDSSYYASQFMPYALASYQLVYENLYENYNQYYDPPYDSIIADWLNSGTHSSFEWYQLIPPNFYDFMQDSVLDNIQNNPNHPVNIDARQNDLHNWIPQEPVRMLYCGMDSMVFPQNSIMALDTMIALGATDVQALELDPLGDHNGCRIPATTYALEWFDSLMVECGMVTGLPIVEKKPEISLYPNPVKNIATFSTTEITSIELYDLMGAVIIKRNNNKVDMTKLNPGIYFVVGFDNNKSPMYQGKIIKN